MTRIETLYVCHSIFRSNVVIQASKMAFSLTLLLALGSFAIGQTYTYQVLYTFQGGADGASPSGPLFRNAATGDLYGVAAYGGTPDSNCPYGCGVTFKVDPSGNETVVYSFTGGANGTVPVGRLTFDPAGNIYGVTQSGGDPKCGDQYGCGIVYELSPSGVFTVLHTFEGTGGAFPYSGVLRDQAGNLYGTTGGGGRYGDGVVYRLNTDGSESVLHVFDCAAGETGCGGDGALPRAGLIRDSSGNLYGATLGGGANSGGAVFEVEPSGKETLLYSFNTVVADGDGFSPSSDPGTLILDSAGNLYGVTSAGGGKNPAGPCLCPFSGPCNCGIVYKVDSAGNETVLYRFKGETDGGGPMGTLSMDGPGSLYGTTTFGGLTEGNACTNPNNNENYPGCGTIFKVGKYGAFTILHQFSGSDGSGPDSGIIWDAAGNIYGVTPNGGAGHGVVFKMTP